MSDLPPEGRPTLPPHWQELSPLLDAVLDAPPADRAALILQLSAGDAVRQRALTDLLAECERATPLLDRLAAERFDGLATEVPASLLPERLGDRYRIGRELGRGGMARVYLARDEKHGRDVAIKVIRPDLSASLGDERFLREIEIAARLRHPNIVPLYDSGNIDGSLYFVMPYEEGPSLRERLARDGALPIPEALNVLRDVTRALVYAHEHGVVHRDIKPDNVMLSGGAAVVTDFGIAKAVSAALTDVSGPTLTQSGSAIGTPAYMAPEQATGDPATDHRADIYSFGCLAYELFTGRPPFASESMHLVLAAHLGTVPKPVTALRTEVPAAVSELLARCLEKSASARPQSARELLSALEGAVITGPSTAEAATPAIRRRGKLMRWTAGVLALGVIGTAGYFASRGVAGSAPITLSVLPFGNIAADSAIDYVANGLPDEVMTALDRVPGIEIKSRNGARSYRGHLTPDLAEAGVRLNAEYLMTGVVRQDRGRWILSAELTRAADGTSLWGDQFNVSPDQQAGAAEVIAGSLAAALRTRFPESIGSPPALAANQRSSNAEAYHLYLRGKEKLSRRLRSVQESVDLFREAIQLDSLYAPAYAGLSLALALSPYFHPVSTESVAAEATATARRALQRDPTLAGPHVALGLVLQHGYQWESAESEFRTALQLDSRDVEARVQYGRHLSMRRRHAEAMKQFQAAREYDPASAVVRAGLSFAWYGMDRLDSALAESARALQIDSENLPTLVLSSISLLAANRIEESVQLALKLREVHWISLYVLAKSGQRAAVLERLKILEETRPTPWMAHTARASAMLGLGDTAQALSALERATDAKEMWPSIHSGVFDGLRGQARFQTVLRRVGLDR